MNRTIQATHPDFPELTKTRTTGAEVKLIWDAKHESGCYRVYVPAKAAAR